MTTEVSGRITGWSVLEPFSAHRASTKLKVGPNRGPPAPQEQRKAPRGARQRKTGPEHALYVSAGHDTDQWARARAAHRVTTTTKGGGRRLDRPRPSALSRERSRGPQEGARARRLILGASRLAL